MRIGAGFAVACWTATSACHVTDGSDRESQHARVGDVSLEMPIDWHRSDVTTVGITTSTWTPEHNVAKESLTIIVTTNGEPAARQGGAMLERMLLTAQRSLRNPHISRVTPVATPQGLTGARVEVKYVPGDLKQFYHRVHVVLTDPRAPAALVHVLYTAAAPGEALTGLNMALDTIRHGEG